MLRDDQSIIYWQLILKIVLKSWSCHTFNQKRFPPFFIVPHYTSWIGKSDPLNVCSNIYLEKKHQRGRPSSNPSSMKQSFTTSCCTALYESRRSATKENKRSKFMKGRLSQSAIFWARTVSADNQEKRESKFCVCAENSNMCHLTPIFKGSTSIWYVINNDMVHLSMLRDHWSV